MSFIEILLFSVIFPHVVYFKLQFLTKLTNYDSQYSTMLSYYNIVWHIRHLYLSIPCC